jgi:DsbC/DsbD-like thiol-disulfide interchange protein
MWIMKRRSFLGLAAAVVLPKAAWGQEPPWTGRILKGGFDGQYWWAGYGLSLQPKWKTYWRVPGEGGIAPDISLKGTNLKSFEVFHPLPQRFEDEAGMTIGYKQEVVFPIRIAPEIATKRLPLQFTSFVGVCDVVCIPAQYAQEIFFDPANADSKDQVEISRWMDKVPVVQDKGPVTAAKAVEVSGKPALQLSLSEAVKDIFVEGNALHYFGKPQFDGQTATLLVSGAKSLDELKAMPIRLTIDLNNTGLERMLQVV